MLPTWITAPNGAVYLNDLKRYVKGTILVPQTQFVPLVIAAAPSATIPTNSPPIILESGADAVSEIFSSMGEHDSTVLAAVQNRMTVLITDTSWRRRLMNRAILVNHVFGTNLNPYFFSESLLLEAQQTFQLDFQNNSVAGVTGYRFSFEARKFQSTALSRKPVTDYIGEQRLRKLFLRPQWLTTDSPVVIPAGGNITAFVQTNRDAMQVLFGAIASFISTGVAGDTAQGFTVRLFDAKTDRPLQTLNQALASSCCSGTAGFPFLLPTGWMIEPFTQIRMEFTNLITDQPTEVFWTWIGVSIYTAPTLLESREYFAEPSTPSRGAS